MGSIRILHLEDSHLDADLTTAYLTRGGIEYAIDRVERREDFLRALREKPYDLILADYALPEFDGVSALELASREAPLVPFIFVSGTLGEDIAIQSLQRGATDYVLKTRLDRLVPAVRRACREQQERNERLRSQERLRESERRYRQLADAMKQLVWTTDVRGTLTYANREFLDYLGGFELPATEPHDPDLIHEEDRHLGPLLFGDCLPGNDRFQVEYRLRCASDGQYRWHLVSFVPMYDEHGRKDGWVGTAVDVEDQKHREHALITSEKLAATGRMAASIAHEINNPLEALANLLYLIGSREQLSADGAAYLEMAEHELTRAAQITKQTLGFYRENAGFSTFAIDELMDEVLGQYRNKIFHKEVIIDKSYLSGARVMALRGEIRQVFANLIVNAIDAVGHGGRIWIDVQESRHDGSAGYRIIVGDNGMGITEENIARIFQPFFTTKKDVGTGLGLWVCREIVRKHHGEIEVDSQASGRIRSTQFSVFLPEEQPSQNDVAEMGGLERGSAA